MVPVAAGVKELRSCSTPKVFAKNVGKVNIKQKIKKIASKKIFIKNFY